MLACSLPTVVIGAGSVFAGTVTGAATSGWYVATTPGTGADDILLSSSCANAVQCVGVGISIENIATNSTFAPLVESWNGSSWSLGAQPPAPAGHGAGFFGVSCVSGSDCWAVGAVVGQDGDGNPSGTLIENWNGTSWSIVPSPTPTDPGVVGAVLQGVSCTSASDCLAVGFSTDDHGENLNAVIEQWNGSAWSLVPGADTGQNFAQLSGIAVRRHRRLLGCGQCGPGSAEPELPPDLPRRHR